MISEQHLRERLKSLRIKSGLSEADVASKLGKAGNSYVNRIENGPTKINIEILQELCAFYKVNPLELFQNDQPTQTQKIERKGFFEKSVFRGLEGLKETVRAEIKEQLPTLNKIGIIQKALERSPVTLDDISISLKDVNLSSPFAAQSKAREAAKSIRSAFKIDQNSSLDILSFCNNYLNIPVCGLDLGTKCWGLYSSDKNGNPLIIYSNAHPYAQRNIFTIAHEVGHYLFAHDSSNIDCEGEDHTVIEKVANTFAQELLVPGDALRKVYDDLGLSLVDSLKPHHIISLCDHFKVSFFMMIVCLSQTKKINSEEYEKFKEYCEKNLETDSAKLNYFPEKYFSHSKTLRQQLRDLVLIALRKEVISFFDASKMLDEPTHEIKASL